jgi:tRNA A37 threonylcarbamoyladenosine dehydratase
MTIIDGDVVDPSNRNRQLPALSTNHGAYKADIMKERLLAINPELEVVSIKEFIEPGMVWEHLNASPDYIIDAIDSITPKMNFLALAWEQKIPIISSMGAGGKLDPTQFTNNRYF